MHVRECLERNINSSLPSAYCSCLRTTHSPAPKPTYPTMLALPLPTTSYSTLPQLTPPNTSLNYHYQNQSHCIIQDYIRSPASMNQSSYFCYNSLLAVNTCRLMYIIWSKGLRWCRKVYIAYQVYSIFPTSSYEANTSTS